MKLWRVKTDLGIKIGKKIREVWPVDYHIISSEVRETECFYIFPKGVKWIGDRIRIRKDSPLVFHTQEEAVDAECSNLVRRYNNAMEVTRRRKRDVAAFEDWKSSRSLGIKFDEMEKEMKEKSLGLYKID